MRITYDAEIDALYIGFRDTTVTTKELGDGIAVDLDSEGRLVGIEILDATERLGDTDTFRQITLENIALVRPA